MNYRTLLILLCLPILLSCSQKQSPILLECVGVETTSGGEYGKRIESSSQKVHRTFKFLQDYRTVKEGYLDLEDKDSKFKESKKLVWIFSVDNSVENFEEDTYTFFPDNTRSKNSSVTVSDTELFSIDKNSSEYKNNKKLGSWVNYTVTINRISGDFRETRLENFKSSNSSFQIVTEGNCKKVDPKF